MFKNNSKLHHHWEIKPALPWYQRRSVIVSLLVIVSSFLGSYAYLNFTLYTTHKSLKELTRRHNALTKDYLEIKTAKVRLQRELEVSKQSQIVIKDSLLSLHQQSQDLTEQLDLYKRIMSANEASESVVVENLQIKPLEQENAYLMSWVMLQASNKKNLLQGKVDFKINGKLGDTTKTLSYSQIAVNNNDKINYKFRDFQYFNSKILLPKDYQVSNVTFEISDNKTKVTKSKTYTVTMLGRKINVAQTQEQSSRLKASS